MSYFQSFHFSIFSFLEAIFLQNAAFPEFCTLERLISIVFIFRFLASQKLFFAKRCISGVLHSGISYFQSFHFSIFSFPEAFFLQNAAFAKSCTLEYLISKVFIFRFLDSQKLFFAKRFISGVLHSGMSYFQSFLSSIFSFPESFFPQNAAFPEFCTLEYLISKVFIFRFLASQKLFFEKRCIPGVLHSGMSYFQSFHFSIFSFPEVFFWKTLHFWEFPVWDVLFPKFSIFHFLIST